MTTFFGRDVGTLPTTYLTCTTPFYRLWRHSSRHTTCHSMMNTISRLNAHFVLPPHHTPHTLHTALPATPSHFPPCLLHTTTTDPCRFLFLFLPAPAGRLPVVAVWDIHRDALSLVLRSPPTSLSQLSLLPLTGTIRRNLLPSAQPGFGCLSLCCRWRRRLVFLPIA